MNIQNSLTKEKVKLKESIDKNPNNINLLNDYADICVQLSDLDTALISYKKSLSLNSNQPKIHFYIGLILKEEEKFADALNYFNSAINLGLRIAEVYFNRGNIFWRLNKPSEALKDFNGAILLNSNESDYFYNRALLLKDMGDLNKSLSSIEKAIEIDSNNDQNLFVQAMIFQDLHLYKDAIKTITKAIGLNQNNSLNYFAKSRILLDIDKFDESLIAINQAIRIDSNIAKYYFTKSLILKNMSLYEQAVFEIEKAIKIEPHNSEFLWNHSVICLLKKDFEKAWVNFDQRWYGAKNNSNRININKPLWNGLKQEGVLLIWHEQGIGDQILYLKFIENIPIKHSNINVFINKKLVKIFEKSFPDVKFIADDQNINSLHYDFQISMGGLAKLYLRTELDLIHLKSTFLYADIKESIAFRDLLKKKRKNKILCGISWNSNNIRTKKYKSIELKSLLPILNLENITFVNIDCCKEKKKKHSNLITVDKVDNFNNIYSLSSLINACDIIITVSNTTAHIAGALGKKTYLLLSSGKGNLWYWHHKEGQSLWYPSIKIYQQIIYGSWKEPISLLKNDLQLLD